MGNNKPIISVILPSLNVVEYIEQCLESVVNQTLKNIEIICVDAGSDDGTLEIINKYSNIDFRVKVIHSDKKSYGYQMNLGIENANGEYIGIVETDDFIDEKMYESLYKLSDNGFVDIVKSNFFHFYGDDFKKDGSKKQLPYSKFKVIDNSNILNGHPSIWAAIYKKDFLEVNNIKFMEESGGGWVDNPFLFRTMLKSDSIVYTDDAFYYYRELNPNSSTNNLIDLTLPMKRMMNILDILDEYNCKNESILVALYIRIFWHIKDVLNKDNFKQQKISVIKSFFDVLSRVDEKIIMDNFNYFDQKLFFKYSSPLVLYTLDNSFNNSNKDLKYIINENNFLYSTISNLENKNDMLLNKNKKLRNNIKSIKNSKSFKLGSFFAIPFRKLKKYKMKNSKFKPIKLPKKNSKRILFIPSDNNRTSGAFLSMVNLIVNLRDKYNLDIFVILPERGHGEDILKMMDIPYQLIPSQDWVIPLSQKHDNKLSDEIKQKKKKNSQAIKNIRKFIKTNDIDLVHINTTYSYVGAKAAIKEKVPFVWHLREFLEEDQSNTTWNRDKSNLLINKSNKIIAISDSIYNKYEDIFDENRLIRVYNGIDSNRFYKPDKIIFNDKRIKFIMVGGFEYYKGQIELAKAFSKLYKNGFKNFDLYFIGTGRDDVKNEVKNIFSSNNVENVHYLGYKENVQDYYEKSDISFTCAKSEAFGRTTVEAMLSGNLVIGANSAGTSELIKDNVTGLLFNKEDINDLCETILWAVNNLDKSKEIAKNGQDYMFQNMTAEINADKIYDIYMGIFNEN